MNFEAFVNGDRIGGLGLIARDDHGDVVVVVAYHPFDVLPLFIVEVVRFRWALTLEAELGFQVVCFDERDFAYTITILESLSRRNRSIVSCLSSPRIVCTYQSHYLDIV